MTLPNLHERCLAKGFGHSEVRSRTARPGFRDAHLDENRSPPVPERDGTGQAGRALGIDKNAYVEPAIRPIEWASASIKYRQTKSN
jgi:hypothetical protein